MTLTYRALRGVFTAGLKGFYNTVEVRCFTAVLTGHLRFKLGWCEREQAALS